MLRKIWTASFFALAMAGGCSVDNAQELDSASSELSLAGKAPMSRWIGPLEPKRPGPDGFCHDGETGCGAGCCLSIEACFGGQCFIKEDGDAVIGGGVDGDVPRR